MRPENEVALCELVATAKAPLAIQGGGTRGASVQGDLLCTAGLSGVHLYEPGALTLVAAAGTPLRQIEAVLAEENQQLAFEPMDLRRLLGSSGEPTLGGVVATNLSGPRRVQAGACRDHLLGVRYVDGSGTVIKNGGRVMKNVTGYDLVKLMAGSWGTLGVLSEVSLKVLPKAETETTLCLLGCRADTAIKAMSAALGSPFEVTGAAFDPHAASGATVLIRIEGFEDSVSYRAERLRALLARFGDMDQDVQADKSVRLWAEIRDVAGFADQPGDVWRLSVKPSDAPEVAERLGAQALLFDWGGGLIWARMQEGTDMRSRAGVFEGHATLIRSSAATRNRLGMFHPQPATLEQISRGLRARFDPRGIFNTGLMDSPQTVGA